jgi:hypothetical protein
LFIAIQQHKYRGGIPPNPSLSATVTTSNIHIQPAAAAGRQPARAIPQHPKPAYRLQSANCRLMKALDAEIALGFCRSL